MKVYPASLKAIFGQMKNLKLPMKSNSQVNVAAVSPIAMEATKFYALKGRQRHIHRTRVSSEGNSYAEVSLEMYERHMQVPGYYYPSVSQDLSLS